MENMKPKMYLVLSSIDSMDKAVSISEILVNEGKAACVSILPGVKSIYRWQGELMREEEILLLVKAPPENVEKLVARIESLHPYELPEIVAVPVDAGLDRYFGWVGENARGDW